MKITLLAAAFIFAASTAFSQHAHGTNAVRETGQSQFAAIAEIVTLLRDDPKTNWADVNIDALRDHLMDMDAVTTQARVKKTVTDLAVTFTISGEEAVAPSIQRMVLAHSPMLEKAADWQLTAAHFENGATMTVQATSQDDLAQILGLGFFGLMTIGAHHQRHHLMIANGHSPH
jgi:hypothetical protein